MNPKYPIYVISKGRADTRLTSRCFEKAGISYRIVIEPQEYDAYAAVIDPQKILVLPFSNLDQGSIPARNWVWGHSIQEGWERHWIVDDNIRGFYRNDNGLRLRIDGASIFRAMEDFVDRYTNIALAGPDYAFFSIHRRKPFRLNTRIYSCILIDNKLPFRWRGRYNEDTDLSLRILKAGYCTILFYTFLQMKTRTMTMPGGNTEALYLLNNGQDGRLLMAQSLQQQHPDIVNIKRRWGRWQHVVDYRPFKNNRLIRRKDIVIPEGVNNYGMVLKRLDSD